MLAHSSTAVVAPGVPPEESKPPSDCVPAPAPVCLAVLISATSAQDEPFHNSVLATTEGVAPPARKDGMAAKKGTTSAGLGFGGNDGTADISASEEWSGSSITTKVLTD